MRSSSCANTLGLKSVRQVDLAPVSFPSLVLIENDDGAPICAHWMIVRRGAGDRRVEGRDAEFRHGVRADYTPRRGRGILCRRWQQEIEIAARGD